MRTFEHVTYHDGGDDTEYRFSARLVVHAGVPERGGLFPLSYGVDRGNPVVVIEQKSGDQRTSHGSVLQAIHPRDARALAKMLVDAANALDPEGCVDYPTPDKAGRIIAAWLSELDEGITEATKPDDECVRDLVSRLFGKAEAT